MSKTKFPHPSAPTISRTLSGSRISTDAEGSAGAVHGSSDTGNRSQTCLRLGRGPSQSPPVQGAYSGRQGPSKKPPGLASTAQRGGPRKDGKAPAPAAPFLAGETDKARDKLNDGDTVRGSTGSFLVKPRGNKGGRRGPGQRDAELGSNDALDGDSDLVGAFVGPRPVYCVCRRPATPGETMLACTDCKESFHGSCVDVDSNAIRSTKPLYVCEACLQQHPRKRRAPGTILGVGSKVAPLAAAASKRSKKAQTAVAVDPIPETETLLADASNSDIVPLPMANQAALTAFMNAAGTMDEDDICPICEDECTCKGSGAPGNDSVGGVEEGAPMPLFSQITRHTASSDSAVLISSGEVTKREVRVAKKPASKAESGIIKARTTKTKAAGKPRAKKGKNSEKSLISRLVSAMDSGPPTDKVEEEELFFGHGAEDQEASISSSDDSDVFVGSGSQWQVGDKPVARQAAFPAPAATPVVPTPRAKTTWHVQPGVTSSTKPVKIVKAAPARRGRPAKKNTAARVLAADVEPRVFEVDAAVIRGRGYRAPVKRGSSPLNISDDELINITDVTSDASGGYPSETEFDLPSRVRRSTWSDSSIAMGNDDDDENIEEEEEAYLKHMRESDLSSSSLSDLDDVRLAVIRGSSGSDVDSGDESDAESVGGRRPRVRRRRVRPVRSEPSVFGFAESDSESMAGLSSLGSDGSSSESDQELEFRAPQTAEERALAEYAESGDEREDALLVMHLEQLRAVRSVIQDCSSSPALLDGSDVSDREGEITFTYRSDSDSRADLSDDLMAGWATEARRKWDSDSSSGSSCLSESNLDRLRLPEDDEDQSDLYSSDSPEEFYTRNAFMDVDYDDMYPSELDLDSASLALGVALSMEQQGYSKEDAVAVAAAAAASGAHALDKQPPTTTITASMNANGEADPIDGIVSIKSSANTASRLATGTHTPFVSSGWRAAAVAAAAAAYLDGSIPPAASYVLPKDLNEARSPSVALAAAQAQAEAEASEHGEALGIPGLSVFADSSMSCDSALPTASSTTARMSAFTISDDAGDAAEAAEELTAVDSKDTSAPAAKLPQPAAGGFLSSQLSNSSFFKPLSSISLSARRTSSTSTATPAPAPPPNRSLSGAEGSPESISTDAESVAAALFADVPPPVISLAEVNAALNALVEQGSATLPVDMWAADGGSGMGMLKRKLDDGGAEIAGDGMDKRMRNAFELDTAAFDISALFAAGPSTPHNSDSLTLAMGAGTPMHAPLLRANAHHAGDAASDDDDWLLAMDQLVDTEALLIKSPPSTPVDTSMLGYGSSSSSALDISQHLASGGRQNIGPDPFARWDRIPVNIFRRSRALASNHRRDIGAQDGLMGGSMSALALTAIKSSRQRRALVNSTLLTQHTLPPPPPPTPLSSRSSSIAGMGGPAGIYRTPSTRERRLPPSLLGASEDLSSQASDLSTAATDSTNFANATAASPSSLVRSGLARRKSVGGRVVSGGTSAAVDAADGIYAFEWLEDDEDLALFAMPELSTHSAQPSMTMMLAASSVSPMLRPFGSSADGESKRQ
ncbi:CXXC-type zinc finger protein 1 [Coemansia spiralis]|uniref:CXXC-type zinc finger protein 1 n=1 Tax=Coemansia spiralis TaxID=417178 RepID=A0A9W8GPF0_9FUNG|nr:CXXC-type zinc finger protein 1 [Coemansia spiralis]